jgi:hypothetical protein
MKLNANEVLVATYIGSRRNAEACYTNRKSRFPEKVAGERWGFHIESAHSELAVCKYLGIYWGFGVNTFHVPDVVNTNLEVRWSSREDMKVRPDDSGIIVSVTGKCPDYKINGWMRAEDCKQEKWKYDKDPICYFVPRIHLRPIEELKKEVYDSFLKAL